MKLKRDNGTLCAEDFDSLYCMMNDPLLSFLTMNRNYPQAWTCQMVTDSPPSFFVGEPRDLPEIFFELNDCTLRFDYGGLEE